MPKIRLDQAMLRLGLAATRSQAGEYIKLGYVKVADRVIYKSDNLVPSNAKITLLITDQYVSRGGYKLASVANSLLVLFKDTVVLDVGSSVGGFTDYALRHGARQVFAVDAGTNQLHPQLRVDSRVSLYERTDIRDIKSLPQVPDIVLIDVNFISLRDVLPHIKKLCGPQTTILALVKPQFEATNDRLKHEGIIKNTRIRRDILKDFEQWARNYFVITNKADSGIPGAKGNLERFYLLKCRQNTTKPVI
ncbi:MAG TPA: TlyA family RNA methyltransferase [Candidatus Saccharimonadales bacterium]|jgi:23S rRNA (cytidine1920-2'-O)/16S rRNA (cytidine1409-2'-O)-methyltransferase|nr:TlyA family RNA methyltransferase [Candidatus Saccharimonadales bacterium]